MTTQVSLNNKGVGVVNDKLDLRDRSSELLHLLFLDGQPYDAFRILRRGEWPGPVGQ